MDISAALRGTEPPRRDERRCLFQRRLDAVPAEHPDRGALIEAADSPDEFPAPRMARIMAAIGLPVGLSVIRMHRAGSCTCYVSG